MPMDTEKLLELLNENKVTFSVIGKKGDKRNIRDLLTRIIQKNIFHSITDPIEWQRQIRDEWS